MCAIGEDLSKGCKCYDIVKHRLFYTNVQPKSLVNSLPNQNPSNLCNICEGKSFLVLISLGSNRSKMAGEGCVYASCIRISGLRESSILTLSTRHAS